MSNSKRPSNFTVILFTMMLSTICALILSSLSSALAQPKEVAKILDQSKQMLIAARILTHKGTFIMEDESGNYVPAKYSGKGVLVPVEKKVRATDQEILKIYRKRIIPYLVNDKGDLVSFKDAGVNESTYIAENQKTGFSQLPLKLIYEILPNTLDEKAKPLGYVIPVNGFGLWDAIYGYLAIKPDGNTIIGISWYYQKETPGLGANIADAPWQKLFPGKHIFQASADGETEFKTAPLGITVVKGKVAEVYGDIPKAESAVDGMAGATLTGNGVTDAYKDVLGAYRPFFIKLHEEGEKNT